MSLLSILFFKALLLILFSVFLHLFQCRLLSSHKFVLRSLFLAFALSLIYMIFALSMSVDFFEIIAFLFFYLSLWNCYLIFLVNLLNSFSLRMLSEILESKNQELTAEEIKIIFSDEDSYESRLLAMQDSGLLLLSENQEVMLTSKGKLFAKIFFSVRNLLSIKVVG